MARETRIYCDSCGELTASPAVVLRIEAGPPRGHHPPLVDLCLACWQALEGRLTGGLTHPAPADRALAEVAALAEARR